MSEPIQQFAHQLASWSQSIIELARLPFRRVETYPKISTDLGTVQPPLVFWINRQSLMAGGILLIPEKDIDHELKIGQACCEALGLKHFVTWEAQQVRIWETGQEQLKEERCLPLQAPDQPDTFRYLLEDVLNALKLLAILGAVPPQQLAAQYFNNLFQITLEQTAPSLIEDFRKLRSEHNHFKAIDLDQQANETNRLFLLKILALLLFDKHPETVQPEQVELTINQSVASLPTELSRILLQPCVSEPPPLAFEAAVGFHHLLMRLQQLHWADNNDKAVRSLEKLMHSWYGKELVCSTADVCIYPESPQRESFSNCLLSDQLPILAATGLFARAAQQNLPQLLYGPVFHLNSDGESAKVVAARLLNQRGITGEERQGITIDLRRAWPSRRFSIRAGQPYWLWECIYLLGVIPQQTTLEAEFSLSALQSPNGDILWQIIGEHFVPDQIHKTGPDRVIVRLIKTDNRAETCTIVLDDEQRTLELAPDTDLLRGQILLALLLPEEIFALLGVEIVWNLPPRTEVTHQQGRDLFCQSKLFQLFRTILSVSGKKTRETDTSHIPTLDSHYLKELALHAQQQKKTKAKFNIDKTLADLLCCPLLENLKIPRSSPQLSHQVTTAEVTEETRQKIRDQLLAHGCPRFPEQYLYFLEHPTLEKYRFIPPLKAKGGILGQFELEDAEGNIIEGYGEELEQTLLVCSAIEKSKLELPTDRHQLATLIEYYKKDLNRLYKTLEQECYSLIGNPQTAKKQINLIWRELKLPEPGWFKSP